MIEPVVTWETEASLVEHGKTAALQILEGPDRPTAIVAHSDLLAGGAMLAAAELGLAVPDDVSIAGFDGLDLPWLAPATLTSVRQPLAEKGSRIGEAVIGLLAGEAPSVVELDVELSIGTTTGPPTS
ncbi:hypothetical protein GCM10025865_05330 [Paraoerskovia sediminicola]|uniref:Transcriptional regulator LacI/GalR-like sensor domain-containing protein n=1 Tax=Paraoerskovia sediminicola TaxID=1138587 RepID=A0ABM8FZI4_9CELL|nr:hypothetical protein GCM10025865_05330 [Paraoerskovia sediminicola]